MRLPTPDDIEKYSIPEPNSGCWLWFASNNGTTGYGLLFLGRGNKFYAHRASWMAHKGPIPPGMCVCHKCDTPACVNPSHLFLGTDRDNAQDRNRKGRDAHTRGTARPRTKLTAEQAQAIFLDSRRQYTIAEAYGINQGTVSNIKTGHIWARVTEGLR